MKQSIPRPAGLELQILGVLWDREQATAREVLEALPDGKPRAYTTVLSAMQSMEKKGLLSRSSKGVAHLWKALVTREEITGPILQNLAQNVFGGRISGIFQQLLGGEDISREEIDQLREMIDAHDSNQGGSKK